MVSTRPSSRMTTPLPVRSVPRIEAVEPLSLELEDFARAIRYHAEPRSNSALGREIVRAIEAAHASMERAGVTAPSHPHHSHARPPGRSDAEPRRPDRASR